MPISDRGRSVVRGRQSVSGHVATVTFVVDLPVVQPRAPVHSLNPVEFELIDALRGHGADLHTIARREFRRVFGPRIEIDPVAIRQGSIEIVLIVSAIAAALGHYNELVNKISEAIESTRRLYRQSMDMLPADTSNMILVADWEPGAAALELEANSVQAEEITALRTAGGSQIPRRDVGMRRELIAFAWTTQVALLVALLVLVIMRT